MTKRHSRLYRNIGAGAWKCAESGMLSSIRLEGVRVRKKIKFKASEAVHVGL